MSITTRMASTGSGFLDRLLCVVGAVACSQGPEFIQQYQQRLGGHVNEARRQVAQFEQVAEQSGMNLEGFITQTHANSDAAVAKLGTVMHDANGRLQGLESAHRAIAESSLFERPFVFFRHVDTEIAQATWAIYKPAVPTTVEGVVYALLGMLLILGIYHGLVRVPAQAGYRTWRRRRETRKLAQA